MFGLVGDGNLFLVDSFSEAGGAYIAAGHEAGAVMMAHGFALSSGHVGVATTTHGPGLTNTLTALVDAAIGRIPLLIIVGDTARDDITSVQNIDQREFVAPTGAGFETVRAPESSLAQLTSVLTRVEAESRPYVLNVPVEYWWQDVEYAVSKRPVVDRLARASAEAVEEAVGVIASARRPLILAGRGTTSASGSLAVQRLAARLEAPIATTLKAKDAFNASGNAIGLFGGLAQPWTLEVVGASDCVIALGAGLNNRTTEKGSLLAGKRVVQVDIDASRVGTVPNVDVSILGDVASTVDAVIELLDEAEVQPTGFFSDEARTKFRASVMPAAPVKSSPGPVTLGETLQWLNGLLKEQRTVVIDGGRFMFSVFHDIETDGARGWIEPINFGSIGLGLGAAIGAYFGQPDRPVLLLTGDGGFMLGGLTEFSTAVRAGADLVVAVLNDAAYGMEHVQLERRDLKGTSTEVPWPDLAPVAVALGGAGTTIRTSADFADAERLVDERTTPVLLDIKLDVNDVPLPY